MGPLSNAILKFMLHGNETVGFNWKSNPERSLNETVFVSTNVHQKVQLYRCVYTKKRNALCAPLSFTFHVFILDTGAFKYLVFLSPSEKL